MYKYLVLVCCLFFKANFLFAFAEKDTIVITESPLVLSTNSGNIYGTLMMPASTKKIPVALIISGSGPTDRNGNNPFMKNDCLKQLARKLAGNHIASLRFDKRGIGESKEAAQAEAELRFDNYVTDAEQWIALLRNDKRFSNIIVIGHSEGSLIGMIAAKKADKFISVAGAGQPADQILKTQLGSQPKMVQDMAFPIIDSLKAGRLVENINPMLSSLFRPGVQPYLISWFAYDPREEIKKLKLPILILQGTNDIQVTQDDAKNLNAANPNSKLVLLENMNHIFRKVTGNRQENVATYNNSDLPVDETLIESITEFILSK